MMVPSHPYGNKNCVQISLDFVQRYDLVLLTRDACRDGEETEEHLAFALTDGRVGILAVSGRKVDSCQALPNLHKLLVAVPQSGSAASTSPSKLAVQVSLKRFGRRAAGWCGMHRSSLAATSVPRSSAAA